MYAEANKQYQGNLNQSSQKAVTEGPKPPVLVYFSQRLHELNDRQQKAIINIKSKLFKIINENTPEKSPSETPVMKDFEQEISSHLSEMAGNTNDLEGIVYFLDKIV